uniref:Uncharacterized protein n=1 Tax=Anopheles funestus TaxID=62324 RepID=A0A4Y0BV41_ANOFN
MPRLKKRVDEEAVVVTKAREIPETLTAGRSRRTIKPNPKYMNDEMLVPTRNAIDENDMSGDEYIVDYEENDDPEDSGLIIRKSVAPSTPQTDGQPRRRGRPPKQKNLDAPRTEPAKNLRKEVLKKMDYKTISISKSRHLSAQFHDGRRKLNLTVDSNDADSADQDEMDEMEMEEHSLRSNDSSEHVSRSHRGFSSAALKKHASGNISDRRGSVANKSSAGSKNEGTTEEDEYDDEADFMNDSDEQKMEEPPQMVKVKRSVGRPRKYPLKQVSPFGGKVLLPGMKTSSSTPVLKRKALETGDEIKQESQQSKMLRRSYGMKSVSGSNRSPEIESDENSEYKRKQVNKSASFQNVHRGPGRQTKSAYFTGQSSKPEKMQGNRSFPEVKASKPTITIVNVNDIMKMNSKSASDIRRKVEEEEPDSEDEVEEMQSGRAQDGGKTNNQLVASILERKRPISLEHLQAVRRRVHDSGEMVRNRVELKPKRTTRGVTETLTEDDIVDFEDVLQKNIVSANKGPRPVTVGAVRGRGRPSENSQPDENFSGSYGAPNSKRYPQGNRMSMGGKAAGTPRRSLQPPRILNATMKLGDNRPRSKLSSGSGDNHYSIDLSDPDNNVKLVSSSNENSPIKRSPIAAGTVTNLGQKLAGVGNVTKQMARDSVRSPHEPKKKRVTVYETWNVLQTKSIDSTMKQPRLALSMIGLGNIAADIKLPSSAWCYRTVVEKRKVLPAEGDEVFCGKIHDLTIAEEDKVNYEPNKILFRRKAASPGRFNVQFDRSVTFRNDTYTLNIDGQICKLMAAPSRLETVDDIETLLTIVDFIDVTNGCLDLPASARLQARDAAAAAATKRFSGSKDPVIM